VFMRRKNPLVIQHTPAAHCPFSRLALFCNPVQSESVVIPGYSRIGYSAETQRTEMLLSRTPAFWHNAGFP